jgi:2-oxoglutarate ferredoxin oxidoreductase subunit beta
MTAIDLSGLEIVFQRPESLQSTPTSYCPGCSHGTIHRLIAEVVDELGLRARTIAVAPVGCAVFAYKYFALDSCGAAHGRAPAMATGIKRARPSSIVFTYQGDGDLASIGGNEILHAAARGECITVFFINNTVYGMTGGQLAPTTLQGQVTTSSPQGRCVAQHGHTLRLTEMLATAPGVAYAVRRSMHSPAEIRRTKKAITLAFQAQTMGLGLSLVEILSSCPTNWHMDAPHALEHIRDKLLPVFPMGDFRVHEALGQSKGAP